MTAAIYARVSTERQKNDMQLSEVHAFIKRMGWEPIEYLEKESSVKRRPVFEQLMRDAKLRKFDVVVVWKVDRFGRSIKHFLDSVLTLDSYGIRFMSATQSVDTNKQDPMSRFVLGLFGLLAQFEREMTVDRVRSGMAEARRQGKHCGRPRKVFRFDRAQELRKSGKSWSEIARELKISVGAARRACQKGS